MKITTTLALENLKKNKRRTIFAISGVIVTTILLTCLIILLSSYQEYVTNIKRADRNYEAEFCCIDYSNALEIAKDKNIKEISIIKELGISGEDFPEVSAKSAKVNISKYDENAIKNNHVKLVEGRFPENEKELVISKQNLIGNDSVKENLIGKELELTINGKKDIYKIVGVAEKLTNDDNGGLSFEVTIGALTYFNKEELQNSDKVNVSILTKDIHKIYETTNRLSSNLNLYKTPEEQANNLKYYNQLLDYSFVNTKSHKDISGIRNVNDTNAEEFKYDMGTICIFIVSVIRNFCNNNSLYVFQNNI